MPGKWDEYAPVRLLVPLTVTWGDETVTVPAETQGVVVEVYGDGEAYGVDFELEPPRFADDGGVLDVGWFEHATARADQLEAVRD